MVNNHIKLSTGMKAVSVINHTDREGERKMHGCSFASEFSAIDPVVFVLPVPL